MNKKTIVLILILISLMSFSILISNGHAESGDDYIYFKNFVRHVNGQLCSHIPPEATFLAYLNQDLDKVLVENATRWDPMGESNISGNGTFGVELGNFSNPSLAVGDSVFIQFTCNSTQQQGTLASQVTGIPWYYFPATLYLQGVNLSNPPQNVTLTSDTITYQRMLTWTQVGGMTYDIYRRAYSDTINDGRPRMVYTRIAQNLSANQYLDVTSTGNERYGYIIFAISGDGIRSSHSEEVNEDPYVRPGLDLTIKYIARLPRISYVWGSTNPAVEGWPAVNDPVIWRAVVKNWSDSTLNDVSFKWIMDGQAVDSGFVTIPAGDTTFVDYPWNWTFDRHVLRFLLDPLEVIPEEEENNNELLVYTNAITAGFYVEQSVYDYFHQYQKELGVGSNCWEDWAHRHIKRWNSMFQSAIYPDSPNGVLDRIRLDKITVVPDGALPLAGGLPSNNPNLNDRTIDLQWGFAATLLNGTFYANHTSISTTNAFYFEGSLLHELGHARYLIDVYGFNVDENGSGSSVAITENGQLIVGTPYMPMMGGGVYFTPIQGLMNGQYTWVDEYSTPAMNLIVGHRAVLGNYNAPGNIGVFMQDLPANNRILLKDQNGNALPYADVKIYQAGPRSGVWYGKYFDDTPDLQFTADSTGAVLVGRCPFSPTGQIVHDYGHSTSILILRVEYNGLIGYGFVEVSWFNMEYWRGNTSVGNYELEVNLVNPASIAQDEQQSFPTNFALLQNYPNPFNPTTTIRYQIPSSTPVKLVIYNSLGQSVRTLVDSPRQAAGEFSVVWNGSDDNDLPAPSGVYFYRLTAGEFQQTHKMLFLK
jgi:hypothetical protein